MGKARVRLCIAVVLLMLLMLASCNRSFAAAAERRDAVAVGAA